MPRAGVLRCTTRLENAHGTVCREVLYRLHPWAGSEVFVHAVIDKADGVVFRCTLDGSETERFLEIPSWMFDRAACARGGSLTAEPFVSMEALNALSALLDLAVKSAASSLNEPLSGACGVSHDQNRGEVHGKQDGDIGELGSAQPAVRRASNGPVRGGHRAQRRWGSRVGELPKEARDALVNLITQLVLDHARLSATRAKREDGHDQ